MSSSSDSPEEYDILVLGSGEAGKYIAWTLAKQGRRVAVVERKYIGGACPNIACLPTKNVVHSAKVADYFRRGAEFGITVPEWQVDMATVRERKRRMVGDLVAIHVRNYEGSHVEFITGSGKFVAPLTLEVTAADGGTRFVKGTEVVINTGTRATLPEVPGLREAAPLTHVEALELDVVPEHLVILGGGYVGLEFAQAMRRFGSRVTVLERGPRLLGKEDDDVSAAVQEALAAEGIEFVMNARVAEVGGRSGETVALTLGDGEVISGSHLLVASGRTPNTEGIGLEIAGVATGERGYITVDETLRTTAPHVWAAGDCAGSPHFTHISFDDFRVIRDNLTGHERVTTGRQVPFCMFVDPELGRIGLSENEAKAAGISYRLVKAPMAAVLRTRTLSETRGFMKALIAADSDRILGFTVFGTGAGEITGAVQIAMLGNLPYTALRDAVLIHPTLLEGLTVLFSAAPKAP
ncbi:MAG: mercuric reductase [Akkermansiaceae bacterium]|nr:mercuric reductase [Akkermansiaceae bacterium]